MKSYNNKNSCNPFVLCTKDSNSRNTYQIVLTELLLTKKYTEGDQCLSKLLEIDFGWICFENCQMLGAMQSEAMETPH